MNVQMSVCRRVKEGWKKKEDAAISRLSRCSFRRDIIRGELSSDYSREFELAVLDLEKKKTTVQNDDMEVHERGGVCRTTSL